MRWAQLVFTEDDPGNYDQQFWLDYFKRTHSDAACLAGGGYMAFYPSKIPLHHRSKFLGNRDPFGDLVNGCRKLGMYVVARTDPHAAHQELYDAHADWIAVDEQGRKRRHWANPELWVTCALGPMNFEFMTQVNNEIVHTASMEFLVIDGLVAVSAFASTVKQISRPPPVTNCRVPPIRKIRPDALTFCGARNACSIYGGCGIRRFARSMQTRDSFRTREAARSANLI
jgi:hypothetical protein